MDHRTPRDRGVFRISGHDDASPAEYYMVSVGILGRTERTSGWYCASVCPMASTYEPNSSTWEHTDGFATQSGVSVAAVRVAIRVIRRFVDETTQDSPDQTVFALGLGAARSLHRMARNLVVAAAQSFAAELKTPRDTRELLLKNHHRAKR